MSGTLQIERNAKTGRFQPGNNGGPGRKPGSRNALGQAFLEDLRDAWERHGAMALARCAVDEPAQFVYNRAETVGQMQIAECFGLLRNEAKRKGLPALLFAEVGAITI